MVEDIQGPLTIATFASIVLGIISLVLKSLWSAWRKRLSIERRDVEEFRDYSTMQEFLKDCKIENKATRTTLESQGRIMVSLSEKISNIDQNGSTGVRKSLDKVNDSLREFAIQVGGLSTRVGTLERIVLNGKSKSGG